MRWLVPMKVGDRPAGGAGVTRLAEFLCLIPEPVALPADVLLQQRGAELGVTLDWRGLRAALIVIRGKGARRSRVSRSPSLGAIPFA
jgi:hypothetical protein